MTTVNEMNISLSCGVLLDVIPDAVLYIGHLVATILQAMSKYNMYMKE